jgi:hypothetical protein
MSMNRLCMAEHHLSPAGPMDLLVEIVSRFSCEPTVNHFHEPSGAAALIVDHVDVCLDHHWTTEVNGCTSPSVDQVGLLLSIAFNHKTALHISLIRWVLTERYRRASPHSLLATRTHYETDPVSRPSEAVS